MPDNDLLSVTLYLPTKATGLSRAENLGETTGARSSIMGNGLRVHKNRIEAEQTPDIKTIFKLNVQCPEHAIMNMNQVLDFQSAEIQQAVVQTCNKLKLTEPEKEATLQTWYRYACRNSSLAELNWTLAEFGALIMRTTEPEADNKIPYSYKIAWDLLSFDVISDITEQPVHLAACDVV